MGRCGHHHPDHVEQHGASRMREGEAGSPPAPPKKKERKDCQTGRTSPAWPAMCSSSCYLGVGRHCKIGHASAKRAPLSTIWRVPCPEQRRITSGAGAEEQDNRRGRREEARAAPAQGWKQGRRCGAVPPAPTPNDQEINDQEINDTGRRCLTTRADTGLGAQQPAVGGAEVDVAVAPRLPDPGEPHVEVVVEVREHGLRGRRGHLGAVPLCKVGLVGPERP